MSALSSLFSSQKIDAELDSLFKSSAKSTESKPLILPKPSEKSVPVVSGDKNVKKNDEKKKNESKKRKSNDSGKHQSNKQSPTKPKKKQKVSKAVVSEASTESSQQKDNNTETESSNTKSISSNDMTKEPSESSPNSDESSDEESESESVLPETESKSNKTGEIKTKTLKIRPKDSDKDKKTIFVGNLPISVVQKAEYKQLKAHFKQFGEIESIRFRSIAFSEPLPRRVAFAKQSFHPSRDSLNAYIVYKSSDSVASALSSNGTLLFDKHIRVDSVTSKSTNDTKRSVFVGGLPLDVKDDEVWECFEKCGDIEYVRVIRDKKTGMGKGFGYVQFKTRSSVPVALKLHETTLKDCIIRVFKCKPNSTSTPSSAPGSLPNSKPGSKKMKKTKGKQQNPKSTTEYSGTRIRKDDSLRKVKHTTDFKKTKGDKKSSAGSKVKKVRIRSRTQNFKKGLVKMKKKLDKKRERNYGKKVKKVERKTAGALKK